MTLLKTKPGVEARPRDSWLDNSIVAWAILLLGFLGLVLLVFRGWFPHDDGALAQAATRALNGELPHVGYHDTYSGLQAFVHAVFFLLFGSTLHSLRIATLVISLIAAVSVFGLARRAQPAVTSACFGAAVFIIAFASYPASMPTWWNAAFGLAAVLLIVRWSETSRTRYLVAAGVITGLSFLVKIVAVYVAVGVVLYLLSRSARTKLGLTGVIVSSVLTAAGFTFLWAGRPSMGSFALLLLPVLVASAVAIRQAMSSEPSQTATSSLRAAAVFAFSASVPVAAWVALYTIKGSLASLLSGWFSLPGLRLETAALDLDMSRPMVLGAAVLAALFLLGRQKLFTLASAALGGTLVVTALFDSSVFWQILMTLVLLSPLASSLWLARIGWNRPIRSPVALLGMTFPLFAFVLFPFSSQIYGLYLIPWLMPILAFAFSRFRSWYLTVTLLALSVVAGILVATGSTYLGFNTPENVSFVDLSVERGGIEIPRQQDYYNGLITHLEAYEGEPIYAGPDAPELYFLSDTVNVTPVLFDFLAETWTYADLETMVSRGDLKAVVVNNGRTQSPQLPTEVLETIRAHFPRVTTYGRFDLYETANVAG